jgi:3'-phosphoadenosine 5'-phosphosulfate sulfotransferase (PAPS reductase)/FAD synthetase
MTDSLPTITHLKQLEAESIHIFREVAAEFENPVMLYSVGSIGQINAIHYPSLQVSFRLERC